MADKALPLLSFVELARLNSFTAASKKLGITQPALSARIKVPEQELGFRLFVRTSRHMQLLDQGRALLPQAQRAVEEALGVKQLASDLRKKPGIKLRVGAGSHGALFRAQVLNRFMRKHPQIAVRVDLYQTPGEHLARLASGELDVAFIWGRFDKRQFDHMYTYSAEVGFGVSQKSELVACNIH